MKVKKHKHRYNSKGNQLCCSLEEKIDRASAPPILVKKIDDHTGHDHDHDHEDGHDHGHHDSH